MLSTNNISRPGEKPAEGDIIEIVHRSGAIERKQFHAPITPTLDEIKNTERRWRDFELQATDWIVPVTDHPQHAAYMAYRQALRDWPSTDAFPDTRPELGA